MFKKNQKKDTDLIIEKNDLITEITANDYVNGLFLDLNRGNFLYYASQYIDNLMIYYGYIKEYVEKGLRSREVYKKSLNLNLIDKK